MHSHPDNGSAIRPALLYVPVRAATFCPVLSLVRTPQGVRTGLGFTSIDALHDAMGEHQQYVQISEPYLHDLLAAAGVDALRIDPRKVARTQAKLAHSA